MGRRKREKKSNFREQQREETRRHIVEAAFRVFARRGFRGTTNREIAQEAGISPGLIYWYFHSKEDLFRAVVETKSFILPLRQIARAMRDTTPGEFLARTVELATAMARDPKVLTAIQLLLAEAMRDKRVRRIFVARAIRPGLQAVTAYLADQQAAGHLRRGNVWVMAQLWMGLLLSQIFLVCLFRIRAPVSIDRLLAEALEIYLHGILARASGEERL
ncbi:MAG: TetR/AcrR family transcriptional regulator [Anaerolineae bacterium]|nr:TetR/AcrR family transcriptional regulator [Thermoflexus sp.]MCS7350462.1 TetR/AcrR family transcriptional regulator [Thermoflexus sp.]MDW8179913.1 TetR/AcrR family transcriptional regulator [Anaerolineae bacterium]